MYYFDVEKFWRKLKELGIGSVGLVQRAGLVPDDVQRLAFRGYTNDEIGAKIVDVLGEDVLEDSLKSDEDDEEEDHADLDSKIDSTVEGFAIADYTINEVKEKIGNGEIELADALEFEKAQDDPRTTLLKWIEEQLEE